MFLKGDFYVALVFEILEYLMYTPVSQTSGRLKLPPLKFILTKSNWEFLIPNS